MEKERKLLVNGQIYVETYPRSAGPQRKVYLVNSDGSRVDVTRKFRNLNNYDREKAADAYKASQTHKQPASLKSNPAADRWSNTIVNWSSETKNLPPKAQTASSQRSEQATKPTALKSQTTKPSGNWATSIVTWDDETKRWPWNPQPKELDSIKVSGSNSSSANSLSGLEEQSAKKKDLSTKLHKLTPPKGTKAPSQRNVVVIRPKLTSKRTIKVSEGNSSAQSNTLAPSNTLSSKRTTPAPKPATTLKASSGLEGQSTKLRRLNPPKDTKAYSPRNAGNPTNTQEAFVDDLPIYDLNQRGRIGNLNWNIGRQLAINNPEYNSENGFMKELRIKENSSVYDVQRALQNYANNNYLQVKGLNNSNFADNRWGTQTLSAWDLLYNHFKNTKMTIPPTISSTPSTNLGYRTENTYEDADTFRKYLDSLRLNSNEALRTWMSARNADNYDWDADTYGKQFWSDVNKITGGDYSDKNLRDTFNTQGRWGSDFLGNGDYSDFQNALQRYAGNWNGIYDTNSRTGKDGIVYSNSYVRDLFDRVNVNPDNKYTFNIPTYRISLKNGGLISKDPIELFKTFHNRFK